MNVGRNIFNLGLISKQWKRETGETKFSLNKLIKWLGDRLVIEIDNDLII